MTGLHRTLPKRAWLRIYRVTGATTAVSVALSIILTNLIMEIYSAGINVQGLAVSIIMPLVLGGPLLFIMVLKHEQLRDANRQLEQMATTDWLTSCLNRGAFTRAVVAELDRRGSAQHGAALLIVDADDFKAVNDRFGHDQGDKALLLIASAIRASVRTTDIVGRLGGEEFGIFLGNAESAAADGIAEQIRLAVAAIDFAPDGELHPLSVSVGGATFSAPTQFGELYRLADQHLYQAKNNGRDQVAMRQAA